jgi:mannose-6-phosphate isomerase-like protein (cupin superfamily)
LKASIIQYPIVEDARGDLGYLNMGDHIPFEVRRVFYIVDIPPATHRGGHAHYHHEELIIVVRGAMTVTLDDGCETREFLLQASQGALYIPRMTWLDFSTHSLEITCLVLTSNPYSEADYIRDHNEFLSQVNL